MNKLSAPPPDLRAWWKAFNNHLAWGRSPTAEYQHLSGELEALWRRELLQELDYLEMKDLLIAARDWALELRAVTWWNESRVLDVIPLDGGTRLGHMMHGCYHPDEPNENCYGVDIGHIRFDADGRVWVRNENVRGDDAEIVGRLYIHESGRRYRMVQRGRIQQGQVVPALADPDAFNVALALRQFAADAGDRQLLAKIEERLDNCSIELCPECRGSFAMQEDCQLCAGAGAVDPTASALANNGVSL